MSVDRTNYGRTADGTSVDRYRLANDAGMTVGVLTWGAILDSLCVPDRQGNFDDVVLGFASLAPYLQRHPNFGTVVGRYANRIANARFMLDGVVHQLAANNRGHSLHGGCDGFARKVWAAETVHLEWGSGVRLSYASPDGEEGYPGTLAATVTYSLGANNALRIDYTAKTDRPTVVNLTNHSYFNLAGGGDILGHDLTLSASVFLPVDRDLIPLGELRTVHGTPFDFTAPARVGARMHAADEQLQRASGGYDHAFALGAAGVPKAAAQVYEPSSGRVLDVETTQPGVQFYTGNHLDGSFIGKRGVAYGKYAGFCLETQHYPDSPNRPQFPTTVLRPGETLRHTTIYRFSVRD